MNQQSSFQDKVESLLAEDGRYDGGAYFFLRDALEQALKARKKARRDASPHVTAAELLEAFRVHALKEFGPMARTVLDYWGVKSCEDVGEMVFCLVKAGVFGKTEQDTIEAFRGGYDFAQAFEDPFLPGKEKLSATAAPDVNESQ